MQKTFSFALGGGLDLATPAATIKPGRVIAASNYEPSDEGGYSRMQGYERFDGLPSPSEASYWYVFFDAGTTAFVAGEIVTGGTSTTTSEVLSVVVESGDWGTNDAAGYLVTFNADGDYSDDESLSGSVAGAATANGASSERGATDDTDDETHLRAAREARRADISAVPGSGSVNGVWLYNGKTYAVRDNVGATAGVLHESSASGWTTVDLGDYLDFSAGTAAFLEGETVTGAPSTATGVVVAVGVTSGTWAGSDAAGRLYIKSISGTFTASDTLSSASGAADCDSAATAVTLPTGGKYEFQNYNFGGSTGTYYLWGVNGVGRGFRFDGTDFAYVHVTGLSDANDKPQHLSAHKKHLFFSIGSSLQHSSTGLPMTWNAITGAAELATGDTITGLQDQPGGVLGVFNRNSTYLLYGDDINNWDLVDYSLEKGAIEWTIQDAGFSIYWDDRGFQRLQQTDAYGDFATDSISQAIDSIVQASKALVVDSVRIRSKDQYRVFFSDNTGIICRIDKNPKYSNQDRFEYMTFEYDHLVTCICAEEDSNGIEQVFFGSDDGFVYQAEKGESFDGALIEYFARLAFCHCKTPRQKKRFHKATLQIDSPNETPLTYVPEFSYGSSDQPATATADLDVASGGGYWDSSFWGQFIWDGQLVGEAEAYIDGQGINISLQIQGESNYEQVHTLQSATYNFSPRGLRR